MRGWCSGQTPNAFLIAALLLTPTVLELQLFLIEFGLPAMLMAALFDERRGIVRNRQASSEQSRCLARKLISTQEHERALIVRELHDEIGQALTAVKIDLDTMRLMPDATERGPLLAEGALLIEQAIEPVRDLSPLWRPAMPDHLGLESVSLVDATVRLSVRVFPDGTLRPGA
jgi:signal transduction histidine kinase